MARVEFSRPPTFSRFGAIDDDAVARAEAALKSLASQLGQWLDEELVKLEAARAAVRADPNPANADQLYVHAHDLKGLGATYDFPLISRVAASLCQLLDRSKSRLDAPIGLVDAHVDAIVSIVRQDVRDPSDPVGCALAESLETQMRDVVAAS